MVLTQKQLEQKLKEWQEILRLREWDIKIKIVRQDEMDNPAWDGQNNYIISRHIAEIKILDPIDYRDRITEQDMEFDLVHELIHLHYALFENTKSDSLEHIMMERSIDYIAEALVKLRRGE